MSYKLIITLPMIFLLMVSILYVMDSTVAASSESDEIIQIPSESTDFPGNDNNTLEIMFAKAAKSSNGAIHVVGSIKNTGQDTINNVDVTAHFFDENNKTVGVTTCCHSDPSDIESGHTSTFDSFSTAQEMSGEPRYFRLSFNWDKPAGSMVDNILNSAIPAKPDSNSTTDGESECGEVTADITLTSNLYCRSDGLSIINKNDLTIDLNGFTIQGSGIQVDKGPSLKDLNAGIRLEGSSSITIKGPGIIKDFDSGILIDRGEGNQISRVTFTDNEMGVFDIESRHSNIEDNLMFGNRIGAAAHSSSGSKLTTNLFKSNDLAGVTFVDSQDSTISQNTIQGSVNGVFLDGQSTDNNVNSNNVLQNSGVDLNNANGIPTEVNDNIFSDNNCNTSVPDGLCLGR